jgi:8-oxo-dGTP diphosphatase
MTELPRHSVSVTGVVFRDDGRVLAIQRCDDGRWVPPGGVLELAETPSEGVARAVLEETGIKVQAEQLTGVYKNMLRGVVTLAFRCSVIGGHTHPTDEEGRLAQR